MNGRQSSINDRRTRFIQYDCTFISYNRFNHLPQRYNTTSIQTCLFSQTICGQIFLSREVIYHVSAIHVSTIRVAIKYVQVMESLETRNAKPTAANTKRYLHHLQLY